MPSHQPRRSFLKFAAVAVSAAVSGSSLLAEDKTIDRLAPWRKGVKITPVSKVAARHTMHTYYLLNPESPDGRSVVFFASTHPAAHVGQVRVLNRETGKETVLSDDVHTEDAHRVALQQWTRNGKAVAYHEVVDGRWQVVVVDVETRAKKVVAQDRQLAFGRPEGHTLPLYGPHWNPREHRGLELCDLKTGEIRTAVTIDEVEQKYGAWLQKEFAGKPTSIAFPTISPDHKRVFFKMAAGDGGDNFMSKTASHRQGLICYDLERKQLTHLRESWGHPAWHPDSKRYLQMGNILFDTDNGPETRLRNIPALRGQHLAVNPAGTLLVSDGLSDTLGGPPGSSPGVPGEWAVLVADLRGEQYEVLHKFVGNRGAKSWRVNHPHPVFSADGKRIYFNINAGEFTQLHMAEAGEA